MKINFINQSRFLKLPRFRSPGSTLVLAILVMVTLSASVYVIGRIAIRTIKQGASTVAGEAALLVADTGTEQGLWAHNRNLGDSGDCDNFANNNAGPGQIKIGNSIYALGTTGQQNYTVQYCRSGLRPQQDTIDLVADEYKEIFIIDPFNFSNDPGYTRIDFTGVAGDGTITLSDWNTPPNVTSFNLAASGSNFLLLSPNLKYVLSFQAGSSGFTVDITSQPKGLLADWVTIKSIGKDPGVSRQWEVTGAGF